METLTAQQVLDEVPAGWSVLVGNLQTRVRVRDFAVAVALAQGIGSAAQRVGHAPVLTLRDDAVDVRLSTPGARGVTELDVRLAAAITTLVEQAGLVVSARSTTRLELGLDTPDRAEVGDFWAAVLGAERGVGPEPDAQGSAGGGIEEVRDPADVLPTVWFQASGAEEPRQRWHPDVWIDPSEVAARIDAAIDAGGRLVSDAEAPAFWVLADRQGNRVCLCTWQGRE